MPLNSCFEPIGDLEMGHVVEVSGTTLKIELSGKLSELTRSYKGRVYPVGQIGSVVKIHYGRRLVFGFVTLLRMRSEEVGLDQPRLTADADQRVMEVELFGEGTWDQQSQKLKFRRGVTTYPLPHQRVYLLTRDEATALYRGAEGEVEATSDARMVPFATYVGADAAPCRANIDKMFGMHCAILGSTGSGKSGAVAAVLHSLLEHRLEGGGKFSPRIVIIDPHGEYGAAFGDRATVYRAYDPIGSEEAQGEAIILPYWLMSAEEFRGLVIGKTEHEATSQHNVVYKALTHARMVGQGLVDPAPTTYGIEVPTDGKAFDEPRAKTGVEASGIIEFDRDRPVPFSLAELVNHITFVQAARATKDGKTERVTESDFATRFKSILDKLSVLRVDARIRFLMREWSAGNESASLAQVLAQFVGGDPSDAPELRIIDISGLPNEVAGPLAAVLARLLFQYKLYQDQKEREQDPVLLVCEEAHRYVPDRGEAEYAAAQSAIRRIAREGRKYGLGLMLISQRPSDIESTVIAQCSTWLVLRLTNSADQAHVARFLPDGLAGMTRALPALAQQDALFVGEGAAIPARVRIRDLDDSQRPRSSTVSFSKGWSGPGLSESQIAEVAKRMAKTGQAMAPLTPGDETPPMAEAPPSGLMGLADTASATDVGDQPRRRSRPRRS